MSEGGPDRPARPQYGEYATPEEQRARIRQPDAGRALETGQAPDAVAASAPAAPGGPAEPRVRPRWDRIVTTVLLALGLFHVIVTAPGLFALDEQLRSVLQIFGLDGELADPAGVRLWGAIAGAVLILGYLLTLVGTWAQARRGRIAFWIPLVGAFVTTTAMSVLINVPLLNDPLFTQFGERLLGG